MKTMIESLGSLKLCGIDNRDVSSNFSGVAMFGQHLIMGADEGRSIHVFSGGEDTYHLSHTFPLLSQGITEIDIEGISVADGYIYVVGSHSKARKTLKKKKYNDNRERLALVKTESTRDHLCRFKLDNYGKVLPDTLIIVSSLRNIIEDDEILFRFTNIPSKENGIDIEGIAAVGDEWLNIGLRGPVLRGNWAPVIKLKFGDMKDYELLFVNLNGLGIRDMEVVESGLLLLAGPVGDGPGQFSLFFWNGVDCIPGQGSPGGRCEFLGELPLSAPQRENGGKAEGLSLIHEASTHYELLIVFDSIENGGATRYNVPKISRSG